MFSTVLASLKHLAQTPATIILKVLSPNPFEIPEERPWPGYVLGWAGDTAPFPAAGLAAPRRSCRYSAAAAASCRSSSCYSSLRPSSETASVEIRSATRTVTTSPRKNIFTVHGKYLRKRFNLRPSRQKFSARYQDILTALYL